MFLSNVIIVAIPNGWRYNCTTCQHNFKPPKSIDTIIIHLDKIPGTLFGIDELNKTMTILMNDRQGPQQEIIVDETQALNA